MVFMGGNVVFASSDAIYNRDKPAEIKGWSVHVRSTDIDTTAELITQLDTTYAQLAAEDTIEVLSSSASDITQTVTVTGINNAGNKVSEAIALDTSNGTTAVASTTTFRYIDQASVSAACLGTITVRKATADVFITSIPIGQIEAGMVQHFNGEDDSYITGWNETAEPSSVIRFELRWYPDDSSSLSPTTGYKVLDRLIAETTDTLFGNIIQPIKCPAGGWISVYGTGTSNNAIGSITIQGYDTK